ncbi:hypothetical protein PTKIN_Ptkin02bG0146000 [Pterospermum kingtungense]
MNMITSKKLIKVARKRQKITTIERKRITSARTNRKMVAANHANKSSTVDKGCFVMHTIGKRHFVIPLKFLNNNIFLELFKMFEEEFGLPTDGPIRLPCDSVFMNYIVSLVKRGLAKDLERAMLDSITSHHCSSDTYFNQRPTYQQLLLCGF